MKKIKLLDCTLRDGGYYNQWDFSNQLISDYLNCMKDCSVDYVELGFRSLKNSGFKGPCAYTKDEFIEEAVDFKDPKIGIMINGSEILENYQYSNKNAKILFPSHANNKLKLVRIACHLEEIIKILPICDFLKKRNYKIGINLMQISEIGMEKIKEISKILNNYKIDVFYIADSLGTLNDNSLLNILDCIRSNWHGEIGLHAHDNMEKALSNSLTAINNGVTWIDSTVNGMGRGPGNVKTELALIALSKYRDKKFDIRRVIELLEKHFTELKTKHKWGTNPYYYFAAENKIHPTYIQKILESKRHSPYEIISKIKFLSQKNSKKFSTDLMKENLVLSKVIPGKWEPKKVIKNKEVLILGNGPSVKKYSKAIESYIIKKKPYVLAFNIEKSVNEKLINARAVCAPVKIFSDYTSYKKLNQTFIIPFSSQDNELRQKLKNIKIKDFGFVIKNNRFEFFSSYAVAPSMLALAYGLAIANSGKAKSIILAGVDGWKHDDETLNSEMNELLRSYNQNKESIKICSITPTKFKIDTKSVFSI